MLRTRTQNVGHFVLEVLGCNKRVEQLPASLNHGVNLATATAQVLVIIEGLPEVVDGFPSRLSTRVDKDTDLWLLEYGCEISYRASPR